MGERLDGRGTVDDIWGPGTEAATLVRDTGELAYVSARLANACRLDATELESAVSRLYAQIAASLAGGRAWFPVRFWNYIPDIHGAMGSGLTRYMVFNAGRYRALSDWLGGASRFAEKVATATGVGHSGDDLHVYCIAAAAPGRPVENPRQVPAYRYSRKYGPNPPCFARATAVSVEGRDTLLVGGTASVRGERSINETSLEQQILETFTNMATLVRAWCSGAQPAHEPADSAWLGRFRHLRAYCVFPEDAPAVRRMIEQRFGSIDVLEILKARVCRPELLVEIEGLAEGAAP